MDDWTGRSIGCFFTSWKVDLLMNAVVISYHLPAENQMKAAWELSIMDLVSDIFTEAFFGTRLDQIAMYKFLKGSWGKGRFVVHLFSLHIPRS